MKFLIDQSADRVTAMASNCALVVGQLLTPLSRYANWGGAFAIDNGAFATCDVPGLRRLVKNNTEHRARCLWVAVPDVVGSARRTLEVFTAINFDFHGWPLALVCQDGQQHQPIPWEHLAAVFIGGSTEWKMSDHAAHIIKAAQILGKHTHVGRVNTPERFNHFDALGVDTCDGSGVSRYDHMLENIVASRQPRPLLALEETCAGE